MGIGVRGPGVNIEDKERDVRISLQMQSDPSYADQIRIHVCHLQALQADGTKFDQIRPDCTELD